MYIKCSGHCRVQKAASGGRRPRSGPQSSYSRMRLGLHHLHALSAPILRWGLRAGDAERLGHWPAPACRALGSPRPPSPVPSPAPDPHRTPHHTHSSCRRCICTPCICRSRHTCRSHLRGRGGGPVSRRAMWEPRQAANKLPRSPASCHCPALGAPFSPKGRSSREAPLSSGARKGRSLPDLTVRGGSQAPGSAQAGWVGGQGPRS